MAQNKTDKKRLKRKAKQKDVRKTRARILVAEKKVYCIEDMLYHRDRGEYAEALKFLKQAMRIDPSNENLWLEQAYIGIQANLPKVALEGLRRMESRGLLKDCMLADYCRMLYLNEEYQEAYDLADKTIQRMPSIKLPKKTEYKSLLLDLRSSARFMLARREKIQRRESVNEEIQEQVREIEKKVTAPPAVAVKKPDLPPVPVLYHIDPEALKTALASSRRTTPEFHGLVLDAYRLRLNETFDHLLCLDGLKNVRSLWYQEETAKKVLKRFRGRALLADEVGLGKTIEALVVFLEYIQRGMVKTGLILVPSPLVSQWREELASKFGLSIPSTDDTDFRKQGEAFWNAPFVLASINQAKSKKNYALVTEREYDMVIVDEAHHLKNRNTLNWKLVNALKKKFLLLLTATPVENNLMELYNLITLLKPGLLKTASAFREEFMTRGDPTDPKNREKLKELLNDVMIRNTRAISRIEIPPRFAHTVRVDPTSAEREIYDRVTALAKGVNALDGDRHRLLLKHLLAEAGSSPRAVHATLSRIIEKREILLEHENEIRAIGNLCRSMDDTHKNKTVLKLLHAHPGKWIIFAKYTATVGHLTDYLSWNRIPYALFTGKMTNAEKDAQIQSFREDKNVLLTTEIGGEGRNLQFCHQMINYDLPWNPMKIEQRIGRLHRIGQEKEVLIYNLCAAGGVEDYILEVLDKKINMFELVVGEIDMILGRIRGEKEFDEMVLDIWLNASDEQARKASFDKLAAEIKRSKTGYQKTRELDRKLFGENYEI